MIICIITIILLLLICNHYTQSTANLRTKIMDFKGFDSSVSIGSFQDISSQAILVGIILVGRLDVWAYFESSSSPPNLFFDLKREVGGIRLETSSNSCGSTKLITGSNLSVYA